jgi:hypothetical protein
MCELRLDPIGLEMTSFVQNGLGTAAQAVRRLPRMISHPI